MTFYFQDHENDWHLKKGLTVDRRPKLSSFVNFTLCFSEILKLLMSYFVSFNLKAIKNSFKPNYEIRALQLCNQNKTKWIWIYDREKRQCKAIEDHKKAMKGHTRQQYVAQEHDQSYKTMIGLTWPRKYKPVILFHFEITTLSSIWSNFHSEHFLFN